MPHADDAYGTKKELLIILIDLCEAKITNLEKHFATKKMISHLTDSITDLKISLHTNSDHTIETMNTLMEDMVSAFNVTPIDLGQEIILTKLVENTISKLISIHNETKELEDRFLNILTINKQYLTQKY